MKPVAAIILNRNLPDLADELVRWMQSHCADVVDIYVVENGSDPDKYSHYANIIFTESHGPAKGINLALQQLLAKDYQYFWVNYNDSRYNQTDFIKKALNYFKADPQLGLLFAHWPSNMRFFGHKKSLDLVSFSDLIGFVVSRRALEATQKFKKVPLQPLWDSSNYSNHLNILATLMALYRANLYAATDQQLTAYELVEPAATLSQQARGYSDQVWKEEIGPKETREWLQRAWPEYSGNAKEIREQVVLDIQQLMVRHYPRSFSIKQILQQYWHYLCK